MTTYTKQSSNCMEFAAHGLRSTEFESRHKGASEMTNKKQPLYNLKYVIGSSNGILYRNASSLGGRPLSRILYRKTRLRSLGGRPLSSPNPPTLHLRSPGRPASQRARFPALTVPAVLLRLSEVFRVQYFCQRQTEGMGRGFKVYRPGSG